MSRTRPALIALVAAVVELVVLAAVGNPSVTDSLSRQAARSSGTGQDALLALTTLAWRTGRDGISQAEFVGHFVAIGVLVVLTYLLVFLLTRGVPSALQVWISTWFTVLAATVIAVIVDGSFTTSGEQDGRVEYALFGAVTGGVVLYGLALGLVAGGFCALVGHVTRREMHSDVSTESGREPLPAAAAAYGYRPMVAPAAQADEPTEWLPAQRAQGWPEAPAHTQPLPVLAPAAPGEPAQETDQQTTQLPPFPERSDSTEEIQGLPRRDDTDPSLYKG